MLTESETSFTTHASSFEIAFTDTGSIPTGISRIKTGAGFAGFDTSKTESRPSGVFTAKRRVPSGERQMGRVCCDSKFTYEGVCARSSKTAPQKNGTHFKIKRIVEVKRIVPDDLRRIELEGSQQGKARAGADI